MEQDYENKQLTSENTKKTLKTYVFPRQGIYGGNVAIEATSRKEAEEIFKGSKKKSGKKSGKKTGKKSENDTEKTGYNTK